MPIEQREALKVVIEDQGGYKLTEGLFTHLEGVDDQDKMTVLVLIVEFLKSTKLDNLFIWNPMAPLGLPS